MDATILENGYINFFEDKNKKLILKKELLIKDHTNKVIDLPTNCKFVNIKFNKSNISNIIINNFL